MAMQTTFAMPEWLLSAQTRYQSIGRIDEKMARMVASGGRPWSAIAHGERGYIAMHARRYCNTIRHLPDGKGRRLLDVGCYPGHLALLAVIKGWQVSGVSLGGDRISDPGFAARMQAAGIEFRSADIERDPLPFDTDSFDAVFFNETVEHLAFNPFHPIDQIWRVLKPAGFLLFSVPNICSFDHCWALLRGRSIHMTIAGSLRETFPADIAHRHIREYAPAEVRYLLGDQDKYLYRFDIGRIVMDRSWDGMRYTAAGRIPWWRIRPGMVIRDILTRVIRGCRSNIIVLASKPRNYDRFLPEQISVSGFFPAELAGTHNAIVRVPIRAAWMQERSEVRLAAMGRPLKAVDLLVLLPAPEYLPPREVQVALNGQRIASFTVNPSVEPQRIRIALPSSATCSPVVLQLHTTVWHPSQFGFPQDSRAVGVMVATDQIAYEM